MRLHRLDTRSPEAGGMGPTASTGTLVLVASVGGLGAFLGAAVGQLVQLYRDKLQHQREVGLRDRDRELAREDDRKARRLDRYVAVLASLTRLERLTTEAIGWAEQIGWADDGDIPGGLLVAEARQPFLDRMNELAKDVMTRVALEREALVELIYEAWPIASPEVQEASPPVMTALIVWDGQVRREIEWPVEAERNGPPRLEPVAKARARTAAPLRELLEATQLLTSRLRTELDLD